MRHVLLPAAGAGSRMRGGDKLLEEVDGMPCLRAMALRARFTAPRVLVTLPALDHPRAKALAGVDVTLIETPDHSEGMSASLRRGASAASGPLMVLPPDMPLLTGENIAELWSAFEKRGSACILRACAADGTLGHPVIFAEKFLPTFSRLTGDEGGAPILQAHPEALELYPFQNTAPIQDLDTPESWAAWRRSIHEAK